jgi:riboflavin-specific deaminase-like protein
VRSVEVTPAVWNRLLQVREGLSCTCCGEWSDGEQAALDLYGPLARRDVGELTIGQIGQSLDGRIATSNGDSKEVSGPNGFEHLHRLRALVDGVVIGVKTALQDTPRLTVRHCEGPNPARVVIDPNGRLPDDSPVLEANGARRIIIQAVNQKRPDGVEVIKLEANQGQFHPESISSALREAGLKHILIEGGGYTIGKFIDHNLLGRLHVAIAPLIIGSGANGLTLSEQRPNLQDAIRPQTSTFSLGSDVLFDCALSAKAQASLEPIHSIS